MGWPDPRSFRIFFVKNFNSWATMRNGSTEMPGGGFGKPFEINVCAADTAAPKGEAFFLRDGWYLRAWSNA
jgi:hypothetical protein